MIQFSYTVVPVIAYVLVYNWSAASMMPAPTVPDVTDPSQPPPQEDDTTDTDAWFLAFAPYAKPRIAVAVMLVGQGAGGDTAAPAARTVLQAAFN